MVSYSTRELDKCASAVIIKKKMSQLVRIALVALQLLLLSSIVDADAVLDLWTKGQPSLDAQLAKSTTCSKDKLQIRKEW